MMDFRAPWMLLLALLIPLALWLRERRPRPAFPFTSAPVLRHLPATWAVRGRWILPALFALGLACLVVALARPRKGLDESRVHTEVVDIVLLVDVSTSMRALDFSTRAEELNRLDAAKRVIREFVDHRSEDRIAAVAFAALPYAASPLTLDHGWLLERIETLKTGMVEDGTAIGDAIASAVNRLRESEALSKVIVLLTDGVNNAGSLSPLDAAQAAKALDIKIYTIGAGTDRGWAPYPNAGLFGSTGRVPVEIDEATLKRIADVTGARYFRATDLEELQDVYRAIDEMEKTEIDVEEYTRYEERFMPWVAAAILFLSLEPLLAATRLGRIP
jgi:Ca-activated chloride channel homolog